MKFNVTPPPEPVGNYKKDIAGLYDWCKTLHQKLGAMLMHIEDEQIVSVSSDKVK